MQDRFGQLLVLDGAGNAVSLDLYEEASIMGRGFALGPDHDPSVLREVEFAIERESFEAFEAETGLADLSFPLDNVIVEYPDSPPLRLSARRPDRERKLITGTVWVYDDVLTFRAEEYGSPEIIVIVVLGIWALVCGGSVLRDIVKPCEERAVEVCGIGGVKSVKSKRSWKTGGCAGSCEIECADGRSARVEARDLIAPKPSLA
jgi:hypothetical protein